MGTITKADSKRRIVLPAAKPGDVFDIQEQGEGHFLLVRLQKPEHRAVMTREECLQAIADAPLHPSMSWDDLKALTREP